MVRELQLVGEIIFGRRLRNESVLVGSPISATRGIRSKHDRHPYSSYRDG